MEHIFFIVSMNKREFNISCRFLKVNHISIETFSSLMLQSSAAFFCSNAAAHLQRIETGSFN